MQNDEKIIVGGVYADTTPGDFALTRYNADGTLMDRALPGAVYDDPGLAATQALALADRVDTLCLHGDSPGALAMATAVRHALTTAGITVAAPAPQP